jgi:hypothetical protein
MFTIQIALGGKPDTDPGKISLRLLPSGSDRVREEPVQRRLSTGTITSLLRRLQPQQRTNYKKNSEPSFGARFDALQQ